MARALMSTDVLAACLGGQRSRSLARLPLSELAISALSLEWIIADAERAATLEPWERRAWRANAAAFARAIHTAGGEILGISNETISAWGRTTILDLVHVQVTATGGVAAEVFLHMPTEERLVVATASASGLVYLTFRRDWNEKLEESLGLSVEMVA
jgi:hypothetical protein